MLKLFNHRLFRAVKDSMRIKPDAVRVINLVFMVMTSSHLSACVFWLVKILSNPGEDVNRFLEMNNHHDPWFCDSPDQVGDLSCKRDNVFSVYIMCIYFAMTTITTVGYGDIAGSTAEERIVCMCIQCFGYV